jgi:type I restriction enzyme S subunit
MEENQIHIPEGWFEDSLGNLLNYEQPYKYTVDSTEYNDKSGIPVLTAGKSFLLGYTNEVHNVYKNTPVIIFDDFTTDSKFVDFPFKVKSSAMKFLKPKNSNEIDINVIFGYVQNLKIRETGSDHKRRWISEFSKLKVVLPPYTEQTQIATILSKVDKAITQTEQLIAKYTRIKTGLMQDLLTKGISQNPDLIISDLKGIAINRQFKQCKLENISKVRQGFQIAISKRKKEEGVNRYIYITVQYLNNPKKYLEFIENPPENVICSADEILFTRTGNTGQIVSGIEGVFHNNFFKVSFDEKEISREYLMLYLNWEPVQDLIKELAGTTTIPDMKHKDFYGMPIFYPATLTEQKNITDIINSSNQSIISYQKELSKLQSLKTGLMQDLLSGKVRVKHLIKETVSV